MTNVIKRWPALLMLTGLLVVVCTSTAGAQQLTVKPVAAEISAQGATLQANFKIEVANGESSAMTNFVVVFDDSTYISIGDVAAGGTVTSESTSRLVDLTDAPASRAVGIHVTLKYSLDGEEREQSWSLAFELPQAE